MENKAFFDSFPEVSHSIFTLFIGLVGGYGDLMPSSVETIFSNPYLKLIAAYLLIIFEFEMSNTKIEIYKEFVYSFLILFAYIVMTKQEPWFLIASIAVLLIKHFINPVEFLLKQIGMLTLFFLIFLYIISIKKFKNINFKTNNKINVFLLTINLLPIIIIFIVSFISGAKIRTMWISTFYLFFGVLFFYFFQKIIDLKKIKGFLFIFIFLFILSPIIYLYISISNDSKRTDYPGREIAALVQDKWDDNFINEIKIVIGDEWSAGNLSYHLYSRPIWINDLKNNTSNITEDQGVIYTGNPKILKKICPGVFGTIKPVGYCMIGKKR